MNVTCSACQTQYKIDAAKVPASGGFIKCRTCGARIKIPSPTEAAIPLAGSAPPAPPAGPVAPSGAIPLAGRGTADLPPLPEDTQPVPPAARPAIPLAGSPPIDDEAPTVIGPPPTGRGAIPLPGAPVTGDEAPTVIGAPPRPQTDAHDQETVIASTPVLPRRGGAIPLAGSPAPAPPKPGAIPLAGSAAPAPPPAPSAIPLAGGPAPAPPKPGAIPLAGSAAPAPPAAPPSPRQAQTVKLSPLPPADLPQAVAALADDDVEPLTDDTVTGADLPTPYAEQEPAAAIEQDLFADLPTADDVPAAHTMPGFDLPAALELSGDAQAAVAAAGQGATFDDLPVPQAAGAAALEDLPVEAPSLMDDLPEVPRERQADTDVLELDAQAMSAIRSQASQPVLALEPDVSAPPFASVAAPAVADAAKPAPAPATPAPAGRRRTVVLAAAAGLVAAVGAVALVTPYLGAQLVDPFGLAAGPPPPVTPTPPPPAKEGPAKQKAAAQGGAPAELTPPEVPPIPAVTVLGAENVDQLDYSTLQLATAELVNKGASDEASAGLVAWARFRLAQRFGDLVAAGELQADLPPPAEAAQRRGLAAAAAVGGLARAGKVPLARKLAEKLLRDPETASPQLAFALATTFDKRAEQAKAQKALARAVELGGRSADLALWRGKLLLLGREPAEGATTLLEVALPSKDPEVRLWCAEQLLAARRTEELGKLLAGVGPDAMAVVPPSRRASAARLLAAAALRTGDLAAAAAPIAAQAKADPTDVGTAIAHLRLQAYGGADVIATAAALKPALPSDLERARLLAAEVRLHLGRGELPTAQAALASGSALSAKLAAGWLKLAEGWIAKHQGRLPAARAAFNAALKGRPKFNEPKVELALLEEGKPGVRLKKLSDLEEKGDSASATYHLARLMRERGNAGGALALYERLLWSEPTLVDPITLLVEWSDAAEAAGQAVQAETAIRALHEARPDDPRPLEQLIALAKRGKRLDAAIEWARVLTSKRPDDPAATVTLAATLNDAGKFAEAQKLLDEQLKAKPASKSVATFVELARAWADREPFRAKDLLRQANAIEPRGSTYAFLGRLEAGLEHKDEAKKAFEQALAHDPSLIEPRLYLARLSLDAGATDAVIAGLEEILVRVPGHAEAATLLGDVFLEQGKPREALKRYELALAVTPDDLGLLMKVARLQLQRLNQLEPAIRTLRRVVALDANLAEPHYLLGLAHKDLGAPSLARQEFNTYLRLEPTGELTAEVKSLLQDLEGQ